MPPSLNLFETGLRTAQGLHYCATKAGLKFPVLLPPPPEHWDPRKAPPCPVCFSGFSLHAIGVQEGYRCLRVHFVSCYSAAVFINSEGFQGSLQGSRMYRVTSSANEDALALPFLVVSHFRPPPPHPTVLAATRLR